MSHATSGWRDTYKLSYIFMGVQGAMALEAIKYQFLNKT